MMRRIAVLGVLGLGMALPALAHVRIAPRESKPGAKEAYTLRVPTEGQVATTSVVLDVPDGVTIVSASAPDGAKYDLTKQGERVSTITWTIEIKPGARAELGFVAQNPAAGAEIAWPVHQKYADGKASDWVGAAGTRGPAPVTKLTATPAAGTTAAQGSEPGAAIAQWLAGYDQAFNAKDLQKLATFYHPDVTMYEGGGINRGWADYRDHHLGPELKEFENLTFAHANIQATVLDGGKGAYVTSEYSLKAKMGARDIDSAGLETLVLVPDATGAWKIRHSHTSARRRAPAASGAQR